MQLELSDSIGVINSIGEQRAKKLNKLGIFTIQDLISYFPRDYEDRSIVKKIKELTLNEENCFKGFITGEAVVLNFKNINITKVTIKDDTGKIEINWYNQPFLKNYFKKEVEYFFSGKVIEKFKKKIVESPDYEIIKGENFMGGGRIVPIYFLTAGISQKMFRGYIADVLEKTIDSVAEMLPVEILHRFRLIGRKEAVQNIHFPDNGDSFFPARKRLVFEELFLLQIALMKLKIFVKKEKDGVVIQNFQCEHILKQIPFDLTNAQKKVFEELKQDVASGFVMSRLVQGDVGSGKTIVALLLSYILIKNGWQVALMVPTEVLAKQHYEVFQKYFATSGIETVLLIGSLKKKERTTILENIENGQAKMVIGTHAVIQEKVNFNKLGLVITDEQHRFGVRQRKSLTEKGDNPHVLVMTATPIPRTLALILYGDLDISIMDELPPGRKKIDTIFVNSSYRERIYNFIKKEADEGRQSYIICSTIEESETTNELQAVVSYAEDLKSILNEYTVEYIHGKMKPTEKEEIMARFSKGNIHVLVSTTVIEVGINVPNATIMLIENAERFGLSALHQLRGRVGRGSEKSYCILISDSKSKTCKERMKIMVKTNDGFEISEMDLKIRGPGEFFGTRQHGIPDFKIANMYKDLDLLKLAQEAATEVIEDDSDLSNGSNDLIRQEVSRLYSKLYTHL